MTMDESYQDKFMEQALTQAKIAYKKGEIPIGAVIVKDGKVIAKGYNLREKSKCDILHAEILAIKKACKRVKNWRLEGCDIFVTVEPCLMCMGAILNARIDNLYYGAKNESMKNVNIDYNKSILNHKLNVFGNIKASECSALLKSFFKR